MNGDKRVLIVHAGGTIGMDESAEGWRPRSGHLERLLAEIPVFAARELPAFDILESEPLLDSAEMRPDHWLDIGRAIRDRYDEYDGFVVLHGTDTMSYTASALAFLFENLGKTVLLTGSQVPLCRPRNDAQDNLVASLMLASGPPIPEVCLFFGGRLFRGCRSVKVNCEGFDAFESPNLPVLGETGVDVVVHRDRLRPSPPLGAALALQEDVDTAVGVLWLFPGITGEIVRNYLAPPLRGAVVQAFGVGNGPVHDEEFVAALSKAAERGVVLVDCTQCLVGAVDLGDYATGTGMRRAGLVSGHDMTPEAALTKLMVLLARDLPPNEIKTLLQTDLRGELTTVQARSAARRG